MRLVLVRGISNIANTETIKCVAYNRTLLSWGSMGEFDVVENYLLHGKYPEGYTKGKKANLRRKQGCMESSEHN